MIRKALVTGCAGFIGSHLVDKLLEQEYEVIGIDCFTDYYPRKQKESNISNALKNENFKLIEEDILAMKQFPEADYVFHLAAQPGVRTSWGKNFAKYKRNNVEATGKLLNSYKDKKIKKFVFASSSSVYGDAELPMKEDLLFKPISPYGLTKMVGELFCYHYWGDYGVPCVSLRYFTVYGPRQRPDMAIHKFIKALASNKEITVWGDGTQTRDFTSVVDVIEATILAANSNVVGDAFNIGGGSRISVNTLIELLEEVTGTTAKIRYAKEQKGDVRDTLADTSKAENILEWKAKMTIEELLKNMWREI